jgi:flagella basal body P-ring formation protein FlgA
MKVVLTVFVITLVASAAVAESLEQSLTSQLLEKYRLDSALTRVTLIHADLPPVDLSGCDVKMIPLVQTEPRGRFPVRVEIYRGGMLTDKGSASLEVRRLADLPVPVRAIKRYEALSPELFSTKRCDVTTQIEAILTELAVVAGCRARQDLAEGKIIPLHKIERIPDIENGRTVNIIGTNGLLEICVRGVALQNGSVGETIQVRNMDSKRILTARVTAPGTVEVVL